ncbi:MAG: AAA family ATPase [Anaerolineae bacterium]|nr:AAA family ATPase [Anaerolineae bacterium]
MSRLLVLLNRLKAEARHDWLTESQAATLSEIERLWRFPERINLYGPPGAGKTFLAWSVARALNAVYYPSARVYHIASVRDQARVVIDNAPDDVVALRRLLAALQLNKARTALMITAQPGRLGLPAVGLPVPTPQDVDTIYRNLSLLDYYALNPAYDANLWVVVMQVL